MKKYPAPSSTGVEGKTKEHVYDIIVVVVEAAQGKTEGPRDHKESDNGGQGMVNYVPMCTTASVLFLSCPVQSSFSLLLLSVERDSILGRWQPKGIWDWIRR